MQFIAVAVSARDANKWTLQTTFPRLYFVPAAAAALQYFCLGITGNASVL